MKCRPFIKFAKAYRTLFAVALCLAFTLASCLSKPRVVCVIGTSTPTPVYQAEQNFVNLCHTVGEIVVTARTR